MTALSSMTSLSCMVYLSCMADLSCLTALSCRGDQSCTTAPYCMKNIGIGIGKISVSVRGYNRLKVGLNIAKQKIKIKNGDFAEFKWSSQIHSPPHTF